MFSVNPQAYHSEILKGSEPIANPVWSFLQEGDYILEVTYENSSEGNSIIVFSDSVTTADNKIGESFAVQDIPSGSGIVQIPVQLDKGTHEIQVKTKLEDDTSLLTEIQIQSVGLQNRDSYFLAGLCLLAALALAFVGSYVSVDYYKVPLLLIALGFAASMPLFNDFLMHGHDLEFHLTRIEGIYQALRAGEFPVRINPIQTSTFGNLTGTMYPQFFLYPAALLRFAGVSLMLSYKILVVLINVSTSLLGYYAVKHMTKSAKIGFVASILYTFSMYRLSNVYLRGALGESLAMVFLPLVIWGIYEILWEDRKKWYILMLGMSGVMQSHVLSVELCAAFLAVEVLVWLITGPRRDVLMRLLAGIKAAVMTALLNAFFLISFLYFYLDGDLQIFYLKSAVPESVTYFSQMFSLFPAATGANLGRGSTNGEMILSVGLLLLIGAVVFGVMVSRKKKWDSIQTGIGKHCLVYGIIALLIPSWVIPWERLMENGLVEKFAGSLQYAWRLLGPASMFLCIVAAIGFVWLAEEHEFRWIYGALAALIIAGTAYYFDMTAQESVQYGDKMWIEGRTTTDSLYMYSDGGIFMDFEWNYHLKDSYIKTAADTPVTYSEYSKKGTHIHVHVVPGETGEDYLLFPFYYYPGYEIRVNGEKVETYSMDKHVACQLPLEEADIDVVYRGLPAFRAGDIISVVTVIGILCYNGALFAKKKRRKTV